MAESLTPLDEKLKLAIMSIMLKKEFSLFKTILYHYDITLEKGEKHFCKTACVFFNPIKRKFHIMIHEDLVDKWAVNEIRFALLHEMLHPLHKHQQRRGGRHPGLFNLAGDHVINTVLLQDANDGILPIKVPQDKIFLIRDNDIDSKITVEEAYEYLEKKQEQNKITVTMSGDGNQVTFTDKQGNSVTIDIDIKDPKGSGKSDGDGDGDEKQDGSAPGDMSDAEKDLVDRALNEIRHTHEADGERGRGAGSGAVVGMLEDMIRVDIPTEQLLARAISRKMMPSMENRSWRSLNRIYQGIGLTVSGHGEEELLDGAISVIDSSGSISDTELKVAAGAVKACDDLFQNMYVIKHDWNILDEKYYEGEISVEDLLQVKGRGGTSHKEVFDRIEELYAEDEGIGIVLIITDFESDIEELVQSKQYGWVEDIPIQIMIPEGRHMIGQVPKFVDNEPITVKIPRNLQNAA